MTVSWVDRTIFTAASAGTGDFVVASAVTGYLTPAQSSAQNGVSYHYAAQTTDASGNITAWEVGTGAYTVATTTLARTTIEFSSNSNNAVNFAVAPQVMITALAQDFGAGPTSIYFFPADNEPPTTNYATLDTRNSHPVLDFDDTTAEAAIFTGVFMRNYAGTGMTVDVEWMATSATTGTIGWLIAIERDGTTQDMDSDSFAANQTITAATVPGTSGVGAVTSVAITNGANMDNLAAGEQFRIRITRDVGNDTAVGDAEMTWISVRAT